MAIDLSKMAGEIVSSRPETRDLLGKSTRTWRVIYMAPAWNFAHRGSKGEGRNPNKNAPNLTIADLSHIPIPTLLEENGVVLMWTPDGRIPQALSLFEAWGLKYNGITFYWTKTRDGADLEALHHERDLPMSTGYITRGNPTPLLMGIRGEPGLRKHLIRGKLRTRGDIRKQQFAPRMPERRPHPKFRDLIEQLYEGPYLELFGEAPEGWDYWKPSFEPAQLSIAPDTETEEDTLNF